MARCSLPSPRDGLSVHYITRVEVETVLPTNGENSIEWSNENQEIARSRLKYFQKQLEALTAVENEARRIRTFLNNQISFKRE